MRIAIPKETHPGENRVPIIPDHAKRLCKMGAELVIEAGMGLSSGFSDAEYTEVGATVSNDRNELFGSADVLLRLRKPEPAEIELGDAVFMTEHIAMLIDAARDQQPRRRADVVP